MATTHPFTWHRASRPEARALRVGRALKRRRIALGLRQADLAVMSGISREDYELVETGEWLGQPAEAYVAELLAAVVRALDSELIRQARAAS
jgi:transcriptional regulator with XRE-family HTH domain